ncbi:MAG: hypothetical protein ACOC56_00115 [Atribacterota bacterium]
MKFKEYIEEGMGIKVPDNFLKLTINQKVENLIRNHLSGTDRKTNQNDMYGLVKKSLKSVDKKLFNKVWNKLIDDKYLIQTKDGNYYKWEN